MPKDKLVEVTVKLRMSERAAKLFLQSSLERVINTSIRIIEEHGGKDEDQYINLEDWVEWKPMCYALWCAMHGEIWLALSGKPTEGRVYEAWFGDEHGMPVEVEDKRTYPPFSATPSIERRKKFAR